MKLDRLELNNFCGYEKAKIDFNEFKDNRILIIGENRDEEGADSNGSGKSTVLEAICWALSGKTSRRGSISVTDVIGPFADYVSVRLLLSGNLSIKVLRTKYESGGDLEVWINGVDKTTPGNISKTQNTLLYYLGVPAEHYKKWFYKLCEYTENNLLPDERYIFINAWNEWAEGAYLEPDDKYGYAYLNKTAEVLSIFSNASKRLKRKESGKH